MEKSYEISNRPTMSVAEVALLLGVGKTTVRKGINNGEIPVIKIGNTCRIPTSFIRSLLEAGCQ